jgi:hypothetical protein
MICAVDYFSSESNFALRTRYVLSHVGYSLRLLGRRRRGLLVRAAKFEPLCEDILGRDG